MCAIQAQIAKIQVKALPTVGEVGKQWCIIVN